MFTETMVSIVFDTTSIPDLLFCRIRKIPEQITVIIYSNILRAVSNTAVNIPQSHGLVQIFSSSDIASTPFADSPGSLRDS